MPYRTVSVLFMSFNDVGNPNIGYLKDGDWSRTNEIEDRIEDLKIPHTTSQRATRLLQ